MTQVASHVSPYRRIENGSRPKATLVAAENEGNLARAIREAAEEKQRAEAQRIWNHVVQVARGCNPAGEDV